MNIVVMIPTFNERDNIGPLLDALHALLDQPGQQAHLLVVDDESPDGTADVVRAHQQHRPRLSLLSGRRQGYGAACIRGIDYALSHFQPELLIQMDADFSHAPADIARLITALEHGADLAIGSRYLGGNRTPEDWGWRRRALSWGGNLLARHWLGLAPTRDCTAGFRAWRSAALRQTDYASVQVQGYAFLVAVLQQAVRADLRIEEVAVEFPDRVDGQSKLGWRDILEFAHWAARHPALFHPKARRAKALR